MNLLFDLQIDHAGASQAHKKRPFGRVLSGNIRRQYRIFKTKSIARKFDNSAPSHNSNKSTWTVTQSGNDRGSNAADPTGVYEFDPKDSNSKLEGHREEKKVCKRKRSLQKPKRIKKQKLIQQNTTEDIETETQAQIVFEGQIVCKCKKGCAVQIDILRQKEIFDYYYSLESFKERRMFLREHIRRVKIEKENLNPITPKKMKKYQYISGLTLGEFCEVCLTFFSKLLQMKRKTIYKAICSEAINPLGTDLRGKHPKKIIRARDIQVIEEFVRQFQTYESQYHPHKDSKKFLHPNLNMNGLYEQYKDLCAFRKGKAVSKSFFVQVFKRYFDLAFVKERKLKKCLQCYAIDRKLKRSVIRPQSKSKLRNKRLKHLQLVRKVNKEFAEDIEKVQQLDSSVQILTFEIFDPFELPSISENTTIMKKRQFWQHTMLIYDELKQRCYVYTWPESIASKGTSEITSCLRKHIQEYVNEQTDKIILYSDPRSGQNRNFKMCLMLKHLLDSWPHDKLNSIEQRFFIPGHAENDCNVSSRLIEKRKNETENIFVPADCLKIITESKTKYPKFIVIEMQSSDFLSLAPLVNMFGGNENLIEIKKIDLSKQQKIIFDRTDPLMMKFINYDSGASTPDAFPLCGSVVNRFSDIHLPVLFPDGREISKKKFDDLQELSQFIPTEYHAFFKDLEFNPANDSKPDFAFSFRESSDEENVNYENN